MFYVYIYSDPATCLPFYVGKGSGRRAYRHLSKSHNKRVDTKVNSLKNNNTKPLINLIETSTNEFALMLEKGLIKFFGRQDNKTGVLYNLDDGGEFTGSKKGRIAPNKGIPCSDEQKLKMSLKLKGHNKGIPVTKVSCIYCKKTGGLPAMTQHHLNNCKEKSI